MIKDILATSNDGNKEEIVKLAKQYYLNKDSVTRYISLASHFLTIPDENFYSLLLLAGVYEWITTVIRTS